MQSSVKSTDEENQMSSVEMIQASNIAREVLACTEDTDKLMWEFEPIKRLNYSMTLLAIYVMQGLEINYNVLI